MLIIGSKMCFKRMSEHIRIKIESGLRRLWPTMTDKDFGKLTASFRDADSIQVSLDSCKQDPIRDGAEAHVTCHQTLKIKSRGSTIPLTNTQAFTLRKLKSGDWVIDKVR